VLGRNQFAIAATGSAIRIVPVEAYPENEFHFGILQVYDDENAMGR
jgi:hypothetical protein